MKNQPSSYTPSSSFSYFALCVAVLSLVLGTGCETTRQYSDDSPITPMQGVLLDPGHGGHPEEAAALAGERYAGLSRGAKMGYAEECFGAISAAGAKEKDATLAVCNKVQTLLSQSGIRSASTRNRDTFTPLNARVATALSPEYRNWLLVSIHFNRSQLKQTASGIAAKYKAPRGFEIYIMPQRGTRSTMGSSANRGYLTVNNTRSSNLLLAQMIQSKLRESGVPDRGVKEAWFVVLRGSPMPSILLEGGFMSNPEEGKLLATQEYQWKIARAVVDGILAYNTRTGGVASFPRTPTPTPATPSDVALRDEPVDRAK